MNASAGREQVPIEAPGLHGIAEAGDSGDHLVSDRLYVQDHVDALLHGWRFVWVAMANAPTGRWWMRSAGRWRR